MSKIENNTELKGRELALEISKILAEGLGLRLRVVDLSKGGKIGQVTDIITPEINELGNRTSKIERVN